VTVGVGILGRCGLASEEHFVEVLAESCVVFDLLLRVGGPASLFYLGFRRYLTHRRIY
jgi:hypothetical protein